MLESFTASEDWRDLSRLPLDRLLVLAGGLAAVALGVYAYVSLAASGLYVQRFAALVGLDPPLLTLVIVLLGGALLLWAFTVMGRDVWEGLILAAVFGAILLAFGGIAGLVAGGLGVAGAGLAVWRTLTEGRRARNA